MKNNELMMREHEAVRCGVGYYDFTHSLLNVIGKDSGKFLDKVFVNNISGLQKKEAAYTTMLDEDGIIIDDVIVFRLEDERFVISTLYIEEMIKWFDEKSSECDVKYEDITSKVTMFAVQGPKSRDLINKIVEKDISDLKFFHITKNKVKDLDIYVARAGFTGELGYELYVSSSEKDKLEEILKEAGEEFGLVNITTDVIVGSLPAEKGFVLMSDLEGTNPYEVGYGWTVDLNKDFIGKEALLKEKDNVTRDLVGFYLEEEADVEAGDEVLLDGKCIGKVTKFVYGYTVEKFIGYALIEKDKFEEEKEVTIKTSSGEVKAKLCDRVFYDKENERVHA